MGPNIIDADHNDRQPNNKKIERTVDASLKSVGGQSSALEGRQKRAKGGEGGKRQSLLANVLRGSIFTLQSSGDDEGGEGVAKSKSEKGNISESVGGVTNTNAGDTNVTASSSPASKRSRKMPSDSSGERKKKKKPFRSGNNADEEKVEDGEETNNDNANEEKEILVPLRKSNRLKGYITLLVSSIINFNATVQADEYTIDSGANPPPPSESQERYALAVAVINMIITIPIIAIHLDHISPLQKYWHKIFRPNSYIELSILAFLALWWSIAVWFNTTITGIAGEGTRRHNLYFSTWICCGAAYWTIERWRTASGQIATSAFLQEMPARSPAWAAVFITNVLTLTFVTNSKQNFHLVSTPLIEAIYDNQNSSPPEYQWKITQTISSLSVMAAFIFVILELFRSRKKKGDVENIAEGIILIILSLLWIPCVAIITCPGGIAQIVGNMYIWSWASTVAVIRTTFWWISDWREAIHDMIETQLVEYEKAKREALKQSNEMAKDAAQARKERDLQAMKLAASSSTAGSDESEILNEEILP